MPSSKSKSILPPVSLPEALQRVLDASWEELHPHIETTLDLSRRLDEFRTYFSQLENRKDVKELFSLAEDGFPTIKENLQEKSESLDESSRVRMFFEEEGWLSWCMADATAAPLLQTRLDELSRSIPEKRSPKYTKDFDMSSLPIPPLLTNAVAIRNGVDRQLRLEAIRRRLAERLCPSHDPPAVAATLVFIVFHRSVRLAKRLPISDVELTISLLLTCRYSHFLRLALEQSGSYLTMKSYYSKF